MRLWSDLEMLCSWETGHKDQWTKKNFQPKLQILEGPITILQMPGQRNCRYMCKLWHDLYGFLQSDMINMAYYIQIWFTRITTIRHDLYGLLQ